MYGGCSQRLLLEVFNEFEESTVVSIVAVRCNRTVNTSIPLLNSSYGMILSEYGRLLDEPKDYWDATDGKVSVVVSASSGYDNGCEDANLVGVYFSKEAALEAAKRELLANCESDEAQSAFNEFDSHEYVQLEEADGILFGIAMQTAVIDKQVGGKFALDLEGSGLWQSPEIHDFDEIEPAMKCSICKEERIETEYLSRKEWDQENPVCSDCLEKKCSVCAMSKKYKLFASREFRKNLPTCKDCINERESKVCSKCETKLPRDSFFRKEYNNEDSERICKRCKETAPKTSAEKKRPAPTATTIGPVVVEKKVKLSPSTNSTTKICIECKEAKSKVAFSKTQWKKGFNGRCLQCLR